MFFFYLGKRFDKKLSCNRFSSVRSSSIASATPFTKLTFSISDIFALMQTPLVILGVSRSDTRPFHGLKSIATLTLGNAPSLLEIEI